MSGDQYMLGSPQDAPAIDGLGAASVTALLKALAGGTSAAYVATFSAVSVSAAQDCFEIVAPSTKRLKIRSVILGQYSDFGDAAAEILSVKILRGFTTSGSGGSTVTPVALRSGGAASGVTSVEINNTTVAQDGTGAVMAADTFNIAAGWVYAPSPAEQIWVAASERLVVRITAPADALTMNGTLVYEEVT